MSSNHFLVGEGTIGGSSFLELSSTTDTLSDQFTNPGAIHDEVKSTLFLSPSSRRTNDLSDLTLNKFNVNELGLHGRDKEVRQLHQAWERLLSSESSIVAEDSNDTNNRYEKEGHRELVWIRGLSGTGKSRLAESLARTLRQRGGGLWGRGKFEQQQQAPYAGLAQACAEICAGILLSDPKTKSLMDDLQTSVASELDVLIPIIPALAEILDLPPQLQQTESNTSTNPDDRPKEDFYWYTATQDGKKRFQYALIRFLKALLRHVKTLVLVLDDLQWSDPPTLELLRVLITEPTLDRFMLIGTFRSDEVDEKHMLLTVIQDAREDGPEPNKESDQANKMLGVTEILVENLGISSIKDILSELLKGYGDEKEVDELASICLKRTHGNAFFLLQFLSLLHEKKYIRFDLGTLTWKIDNQAISANVAPTLNVVDILRTKMRDLSQPCVEVLKLAAFVGSVFRNDLLVILWRSFARETPNSIDKEATLYKSPVDIDSILATLEQHGYIREGTFGAIKAYNWLHDQIQEAAYSLVPQIERVEFAKDLGNILLEELGEERLERDIFVVVNLLNTGYTDKAQEIERPRNGTDQIARLNMRSGRKALFVSAFENASHYADRGIALSGDWSTDSDLLFQLYSISARAEMLIGRTDKSTERCQTIFSCKEIPLENKLEVYATLVDNILARGQNAQAVELILDVLSKFGCHFPKNPVLVIGSIVKNLVLFKKKAHSIDIRDLNKMKDSTRADLMRLLDKLAACMYIAKDTRLPLVVFRSFNWTLKYGYCDYSPAAFATAGMILSGILGDLKGGSSYGEKALQLVERTQSRVSAARTMFCVYPAVFPWTKPVRTLLASVIQAYNLGLRYGDTDTAVNAIGYWMVLKFVSGVDLSVLDSDLHLYTTQMRSLGKDKYAAYYSIKHQAIRNLLGRENTDCPTRLQGNIFTVEAETMLNGDALYDVSIVSWEGLLLFYFGHHTAHADSTLKHGPSYFEKVHLCSTENWWDTLLRGISCFEAARLTGKNKYFSMAQKMRSKVNKWILHGNPNLPHYKCILDAEWLVSRGKYKEAVRTYKDAVLFAARGGYQHEAAIASERLGNHYLSMKETDQARYHLSESIRYFRGWGADAIVTDREQKYSFVLRSVPGETGAEQQSIVSSLSGLASRSLEMISPN